jgi:phosphoglycerate dehydrogenase-like enzyme
LIALAERSDGAQCELRAARHRSPKERHQSMMAERFAPWQPLKLKIWHDATMNSDRAGPGPGVIIYRPVPGDLSSRARLEAAGCRVHVVSADTDLDAVLGKARPVHALLAASMRGRGLDRSRFDAMPELRIVSKYTIGVDDVDLASASELGVLVTHCPTEANVGGVAEGTIALMLGLLKKLKARDRQVRAGGWRDARLTGTYLGSRADGHAGITLGIVGLGRIGLRVAELMMPWKLTIVAADPYVDTQVFERLGVERLSLEELLSRADVVSVHCQLTDETRGMIGAAELALMKPNAVLINTARGQIVDVEALAGALELGRIAGAALDVFPEEPPPAGASILAQDDRVILSPHMVAANEGGTLAAAVPWATEAVLQALAGEVPQRVYNEAAIERWRSRFAGVSLLS